MNLLTNPAVVAAIIGAIGVIIAKLIEVKKKKRDNPEPSQIVIQTLGQHDNEGRQHSAEGIINGIEIERTSNMDEMLRDSVHYIHELDAQGELEEEQHSVEGIINGIEIMGTSSMDEMPLDSWNYIRALAAQGEMLKNRDTIFEVYKEEV